ncbi:uncharacterized protein LOC124117003 [Haliotis rufescens]|uniref:uncharacterized protein LOC124117003 n=1 Tax=Haliotis rufescens TaxID=6454 RepID=UPI00201F659C|nr:uncharacterized protein LOC124117003 [Haliotis rufescens]
MMQNIPGREMCLNSKDFRRPRLTPINESISAIKSNFVKKGTLNVVPSRIPAHLLDVRDAFISLLKADGVLYHENIVNGEYTSERDTTCLLYLSESLATLLDFPVSRTQGNTRCDIFIAMPHQPLMVLTVIDDGSETEEMRNYNTSVAREVTSKLRRFTNESINVIHGVLSLSDLTDTDTCFIKLQRIAALAASFVPKTSLLMTPSKYEHVMMAFWAAVAETKSILTETGEVDDSCINFLTTDQCVYLVENIESKYVQARCEPGSGTTTLMLEVARRLSRLGETLLICNSQEERDRLRSVHSSTITTFDVEDLNMSSFENVVHGTRSDLFEPCGRQWLFLKGTPNRSRDTHVQTINASNGKEDGFHYFNSKDFLRPQLQQTREHITDIKRHYMSKGGVNIAPTNLPGHILDIKDMLLSLLETDESLYRCNLVTGAELDTCGDTTCFVHLTESLAITLDFPVLERPTPVRCDMFLAMPHQPLVVLTVITCDKETDMVRSYNTSVAREVTSKLRRFTNESINVIRGVVSTNDMKDPNVFFAKLQNIAVISSAFVSKTSLLMNSFKYDQILMAFWAALAETKVDANESQLGFLTKEHCILLLENINSNNVEVRLHSKREATVLMLEVARRLSRLGDTLLVCQSREERDRLRSVHASTISLNDVWKWDLSAYESIVLDARILPCRPRGRVWRFQTDPTSVEELKMRLQTAEKEVHDMEKQLCGLHDDKWKRQMEYLLWEVDALKLLCLVQELDVSNIVRSSMIAEPLKKGLSYEEEDGDRQTDVRRTQMMKLQDGMSNQKDLFQLLRTAVIEDKTKLTHLQDRVISAAKASEPVKQFIEEKPKMFFGKAVDSFINIVSGFRKRGKHPGQKTKRSKMDNIPHASLLDSAKDKTMKDSPSETSPTEWTSETSLKDSPSETSPTEWTSETSLKDSPSETSLTVWTSETSLKDSPSETSLTEWTFETSLKDSPSETSLTVWTSETSLKDSPSETSLTEWTFETSLKDSPSETSLTEWTSETSLKDPASVHSLKDLEESQESFDDIEKLTEDLDIVEKEKDKVMLQLSPLYTAEWQNTLSYVDRNMPRFDTTDYERQDHLMFGDSSETPRDFPDTDNQRRQTQKSHVLQIRQFQQGRLSRTPLYAMLENMIPDDKAAMTHYQDIILSTKQGGSALHNVGDISSWLPVLCSKLHLDAARANTDRCHVTTDGELVNSPPDTWPDDNRRRLRKYWGTCASTPIPLPPPHSTLTPVYSTPRYWETLTWVRMLGGEWWFTVLEMGVSEAGQVDSERWASLQRRSWCVRVGSCNRHGESLCTRVWREGKQGECQQNPVSRTPGTRAILHYGVVLDVGRGRLAFIDLNRGVVLARFDARFREDLYPMFGVWPLPEGYTINMKLISGEDIVITDTKKSLIHDALT